MEHKKFIFKKDYIDPNFGTILKNTELILFRGFYYINGGMAHLAYRDIFDKILSDDNLRNEYLKEVKLIKNEF